MDYDRLSPSSKAAAQRAAARAMWAPWPTGPSTPVPAWLIDEYEDALAEEVATADKKTEEELGGERLDALDHLRHVLVNSVVEAARSAAAMTPSEAAARYTASVEHARSRASGPARIEQDYVFLHSVGELVDKLESGELDDDLAVVSSNAAERELAHFGHERFEPIAGIDAGLSHPEYVVIKRKPYPVYDYTELSYEEMAEQPPSGHALWSYDVEGGVPDGPILIREWVASRLARWTRGEVDPAGDFREAFDLACETFRRDEEAAERQLDVLDLRLRTARAVGLAFERTGLGPDAVASWLLAGGGFVVHEGDELRTQRAHVSLLQSEGVYVAGQAAKLLRSKRAMNWAEAHALLAQEVADAPGGGSLFYKEPNNLKDAMWRTFKVGIPEAQEHGAKALSNELGHRDRYDLLVKRSRATTVRP